jgi:hypothetical protein
MQSTRRIAGLALETINPETGSRLYRAVLTDVWVGGSIIDGPVAVPVVGRLGVSIPGVAVSRIPVWSRATRQARQQSKNYRQVFEHREYLPTKVTGRIGLRTPFPRASPCEHNDLRFCFQPVWPKRPFPAVHAGERRGRSTSISGLPSCEPERAYLLHSIRRPDDDVLDLLNWRIQTRFQIRCAANHLPQSVRSRPSNSMLRSGRTTP